MSYLPAEKPSEKPAAIATAGAVGGVSLAALGAVLLELLRNAKSSVEISLIASSTIIIVAVLLTVGLLSRTWISSQSRSFHRSAAVLDGNQVLRDLLLDFQQKSLRATIRNRDNDGVYEVLAFRSGPGGITEALLVKPLEHEWCKLSDLASIMIEMHSGDGHHKAVTAN